MYLDKTKRKILIAMKSF